VGKDQEVGRGPSLSLACLTRGSFSLRSSSSLGAAGVQMLSPRTPVGRRAGEGQGASFHWGGSGKWELPQSRRFWSCVLGWNLTTKSSHTPWGQQKPLAASEANKIKSLPCPSFWSMSWVKIS